MVILKTKIPATARTNRDNEGNALITYNLVEFLGKNFTVNNVQNAWFHEYNQHYKNNVPGGGNEEHAKAIYNQSMHSSWNGTTLQFKTNMRNVYFQYTGRNLRR